MHTTLNNHMIATVWIKQFTRLARYTISLVISWTWIHEVIWLMRTDEVMPKHLAPLGYSASPIQSLPSYSGSLICFFFYLLLLQKVIILLALILCIKLLLSLHPKKWHTTCFSFRTESIVLVPFHTGCTSLCCRST